MNYNINNAMQTIQALQEQGMSNEAITKQINDQKSFPAEVVQAAFQHLEAKNISSPLSSHQVEPIERNALQEQAKNVALNALNLNELPPEILEYIDSYLPPLQLSQVSKSLEPHSFVQLRDFLKLVEKEFREEKFTPTPTIKALENDRATIFL